MTTPEKVFGDAVATLAGDDPGNPGIYAHTTAQPVGGDGHVFAQVGWLDEHGNAYPLRLPDNLPRSGTSLRALYIGLGAYGARADEPEPCT